MKKKRIPAVHPGDILLHEFLLPLDLSQNRLATDIAVSARRINEIVHGNRGITADTALRLARYFKMSPQFWLGLQMDYELDSERDRISEIIERDVKIFDMQKCA
ncbi:MAG: HigA family addiction module antidote protein [Candidatus Riflebacteria bacterium]|nr:HigA family addiction module antidote protein [Candidatus Riflebacteria bacterium]